jgi:hypothetical protein
MNNEFKMKQKKVVMSNTKCCSGIFLEGQREKTNNWLNIPSPSRDLQLQSREHKPVALPTHSDTRSV